MSIAMNEMTEFGTRTHEAERTDSAPVRTSRRRHGLVANDFRRPPVAGVDYDSVGVRGRVVRESVDFEAAEQKPSFAVTLAAGLLSALVVAGILGAWNMRTDGLSGGAPSTTAVVRVHNGETLSDVAARVAPGTPVAQVVAEILDLNGLPNADVHVGQTLITPANP
ncbi:LysM peptidoglycan-binding domain-containing protein [Antrihabitans sp. YC2-6]|uniref:LysM peptidoglycan-binding domain-containing protein n=1 Tax=Antrihabitans sp. YC2-6 TaxID=2799498 RepID=UPI0018F656E2|nr:LysM peptidoglycan-binding domain-containing protein [Antrihabitans sp. YC2-6]MBJ8345033.1 LysM peptidoglycan-binding domain-containing protein [Antrihabitans sp. YC2-6]